MCMAGYSYDSWFRAVTFGQYQEQPIRYLARDDLFPHISASHRGHRLFVIDSTCDVLVCRLHQHQYHHHARHCPREVFLAETAWIEARQTNAHCVSSQRLVIHSHGIYIV